MGGENGAAATATPSPPLANPLGRIPGTHTRKVYKTRQKRAQQLESGQILSPAAPPPSLKTRRSKNEWVMVGYEEEEESGGEATNDTVTVTINGQEHSVSAVDVSPRTTLAYYLREHLRLTGTKIGCGEGGCGACTVMVTRPDLGAGEGESSTNTGLANACQTLVFALDQCAVTTVEAVGTPDKMHPIQQK